MNNEERISTVKLRLGWIPRLRVLLGATIRVTIAHRGPVDKVILFLDEDELGSVV